MRPVKFLPVPNKSLADDQIDWDVQQLAEWLQHLSGSALDQTCEKICTVLQHLNQATLSHQLMVQLLEEIATYTRLYETRIDSLYLEGPATLPEYQQHCVEWLVWSFVRLAEGFYRAVESAETNEAKAVCLYRGIWALSRAYLHMSGAYCEPADGFWAKCYQGYAIAERESLLDIVVSDENKKNTSINQLFKLLLVFDLCDLKQFRPREMRKVFNFLKQFANQLTISRQVGQESAKTVFVFNANEDIAPRNLARHPHLQHETGSRFFMPVRFARTIFRVLQQDQKQAGVLRTINKTVLMRMIKTLGQGQSRQFQRTREKRECLGIIGFANIRDYLYKEPERPAEKKAVAPRTSKPYQYDTSQFEIVSEGDEVVFQMGEHLRRKFGEDERIKKILAASGGLSGDIDIWRKEDKIKTLTDIDIGEFAILNSSATGYGVAVNNNQAQVKVGDLFALVGQESEAGLELAIIRRIRRLFGDRLYLGVELIGIAREVVLIQVTGEQEKRTRAIFLPAIKALKQPDSVVFGSSEFNSGEFVKIKRNEETIRCRLNKLINSTSSFSQAELFYPKLNRKD